MTKLIINNLFMRMMGY